MTVVAFIPARGESKRIPHKNLELLGDLPLIVYSIKAGLDANLVDLVVVSTDDSGIAQVAKKFGAKVQYPRPKELSDDVATIEGVILHSISELEHEGISPDIIVILQPTSPFRTGKHIDEAINKFISSKADTLTATTYVSEHPNYMWKPQGDRIIPFFSIEAQKTGRNQLPQLLIENGAIYIVSKEGFLKNGLYGKIIVPYLMSKIESVDIDEKIDLEWAKYLKTKNLI
jgi:CMP-N,N'-diacetyllegionaminic acid synthase